MGGGGEFINIHLPHYFFLLKLIDFKVCEHGYVNITPPPSPHLSRLATLLSVLSRLIVSAFFDLLRLAISLRDLAYLLIKVPNIKPSIACLLQ